MKESTIQIQYDAEKLHAIRQYMKEETELQTELDTLLQTLYEKHVPAPVREYIESQDANAAETQKRIACSAVGSWNDNESIE